MPIRNDDAAFMARAIELSKQGFPAPNPRVGCVLVREGQVVGEGFHEAAGRAHAEAAALQAAGERALGAIAYVTLEPCNHHGRTPPCTEALITAGVREVVYAVADPNPRASGGDLTLRRAGIQCRQGLMEAEAIDSNRRWLTAQQMGRPFVALKAAVSLDGRIALPSGESRWVTNETSRREAHRLRAEMGAVLVGRNTVELDDPELTVRHVSVTNQPLRIVLDAEGKLDPSRRVFMGQGEVQWWVAGEPKHEKQVQVPFSTETGFDLEAGLALLWDAGCTAILVEGGGQTISRFISGGWADELHLFVAPKVLGAGPTWCPEEVARSMESAPVFELAETCNLDGDLYVRYTRGSK